MERYTSRNEKGDLLLCGNYVYGNNQEVYNAIFELENYEDLGTPEQLAEMKAELELLKDDLAQYQLPMLVIQEDWNNSKCPRCNENFSDYEDCDDGFYHRAYSLNRCPHCGQKITWY